MDNSVTDATVGHAIGAIHSALQEMGRDTAAFPKKEVVDGGLCCFGYLYRHLNPSYKDPSYENVYWVGVAERLREKGMQASDQVRYPYGGKIADLCVWLTLPDGRTLTLWIEGKTLWRRWAWSKAYYYEDGYAPPDTTEWYASLCHVRNKDYESLMRLQGTALDYRVILVLGFDRVGDALDVGTLCDDAQIRGWAAWHPSRQGVCTPDHHPRGRAKEFQDRMWCWYSPCA